MGDQLRVPHEPLDTSAVICEGFQEGTLIGGVLNWTLMMPRDASNYKAFIKPINVMNSRLYKAYKRYEFPPL